MMKQDFIISHDSVVYSQQRGWLLWNLQNGSITWMVVGTIIWGISWDWQTKHLLSTGLLYAPGLFTEWWLSSKMHDVRAGSPSKAEYQSSLLLLMMPLIFKASHRPTQI